MNNINHALALGIEELLKEKGITRYRPNLNFLCFQLTAVWVQKT